MPARDTCPRPLIVVFGAAVRPDGEPTATLARRIGFAAGAARVMPDALLFCSGRTPGSVGSSEASVIVRELTAAGIDPARLLLDEASEDTLQTVRAATALVRRQGLGPVFTCTDRYHQPRARMLFRMAGVRSGAVPQPSDRTTVPWRQRWRNRVREAAALPYDFVAMLFTRR